MADVDSSSEDRVSVGTAQADLGLRQAVPRLKVDATIAEDVEVGLDAREEESVSEDLSTQDGGGHKTSVDVDDDPSASGGRRGC